jgi:hypothetical protein
MGFMGLMDLRGNVGFKIISPSFGEEGEMI